LEFGFTDEQQKFKREVREFCEKESAAGYTPDFYHRLAQKGYLGLQIPIDYGGRGKDTIYEVIFAEQLGYHRAPAERYALTFFEFANLILRFGNEYQKKEYFPQIVKGQIAFGHAYTEPEVGSDLGAISTHALSEGDYYIVNGQKMFWSQVHSTEYSILMAKTDPSAPREKGISLFIVDNGSPGISYTPFMTIGGARTNQVFLDNVKIPAEKLIGEENKGWEYFTQIRGGYWAKDLGYRCGDLQRTVDDIVLYTEEMKNGVIPLSQDKIARHILGNMAIDLRIMRLFTYRFAWMQTNNLEVLPFSSIVKAFTDEATLRFVNNAMQIMGIYGQLETGSKYAPLSGIIEAMYLRNGDKHFVAGGPLVARNYIARLGLDLPGT